MHIKSTPQPRLFSNSAIRIVQLIQSFITTKQVMSACELHLIQVETQLIKYIRITKKHTSFTQLVFTTMLPTTFYNTE